MAIRIGSSGGRSPEIRVRIECGLCGAPLLVAKSQLRWVEDFSCANGHVQDLDGVLEKLHAKGWNVHDLARGRGAFREAIPNLPLPHGGAFAVGQPNRRVDGPDRHGPRRWPFKPVEAATPEEKGFKPPR